MMAQRWDAAGYALNARFVAEMGGEGNVATVVAALAAALARRGLAVPSPWTFPSAEDLAALLSRHGFTIEALALIERPTRLPGGMAEWLQTFAGDYLDRVPVAERTGFMDEVEAALRPVLRSDAGWTLDYVRLRFSARLPRRSGDGEVAPWPA